MEMTLDWGSAQDFVTEHGRQAFLEALEMVTGLDLYSMSTDWENSSEYICKAKGARGDVIVLWK